VRGNGSSPPGYDNEDESAINSYMNFYLYLITAYAIGGVPFGLAAGYMAGVGDVRKKGSGNIGATNVWRVAGGKAALIVFVGDIGKGVAAVGLAHLLFNSGWPFDLHAAALIGGFVAVLGHSFSPFLKFRGGKGVNTALGVFVTILPLETIIALVVFLVVVFVSRYISLGSVLAAVVMAAMLWIERLTGLRPVEDIYLAAGTLLAVLILVTHRQNIKRLCQGNENRFHLRKVTD